MIFRIILVVFIVVVLFGSGQADKCAAVTSDDEFVIDFVLVQDISHSYKKYVPALQETLLPKLVDQISRKHPGSRFGLATFTDWGVWGSDCYTFVSELTEDKHSFLRSVGELKTYVSMDDPESSLAATTLALTDSRMGWERSSPPAGKRVIRVVAVATDDISHPPGTHCERDWLFKKTCYPMTGTSEDSCKKNDSPTPGFVGEVLRKHNVFFMGLISGEVFSTWEEYLSEMTAAGARGIVKPLDISTPDDLLSAVQEGLHTFVCYEPEPLPVARRAREVCSPKYDEFAVELVLLQDATGSYRTFLNELKSNVVPKLLDELQARFSDVKFGLASFGDFPQTKTPSDRCYTFYSPLTSNRNEFVKKMNSVAQENGGDIPETSLMASSLAVTEAKMNWSPGSTTEGTTRKRIIKVLAMATDAASHPVGKFAPGKKINPMVGSSTDSCSNSSPSAEFVGEVLRKNDVFFLGLISGASMGYWQRTLDTMHVRGIVRPLDLTRPADLVEAMKEGLDEIICMPTEPPTFPEGCLALPTDYAIELVLLQDVTRPYHTLVDRLPSVVPAALNALIDRYQDVRFGLATFSDWPQGSPSNDTCYNFNTPLTRDRNTILEALGSAHKQGGGGLDESSLIASSLSVTDARMRWSPPESSLSRTNRKIVKIVALVTELKPSPAGIGGSSGRPLQGDASDSCMNLSPNPAFVGDVFKDHGVHFLGLVPEASMEEWTKTLTEMDAPGVVLPLDLARPDDITNALQRGVDEIVCLPTKVPDESEGCHKKYDDFALELVLLQDSTGSYSKFVSELRTKFVPRLLTSLTSRYKDAKFGLASFADWAQSKSPNDRCYTFHGGLSPDADRFMELLSNVAPEHGGDAPESSLMAINLAASDSRINWTPSTAATTSGRKVLKVLAIATDVASQPPGVGGTGTDVCAGVTPNIEAVGTRLQDNDIFLLGLISGERSQDIWKTYLSQMGARGLIKPLDIASPEDIVSAIEEGLDEIICPETTTTTRAPSTPPPAPTTTSTASTLVVTTGSSTTTAPVPPPVAETTMLTTVAPPPTTTVMTTMAPTTTTLPVTKAPVATKPPATQQVLPRPPVISVSATTTTTTTTTGPPVGAAVIPEEEKKPANTGVIVGSAFGGVAAAAAVGGIGYRWWSGSAPSEQGFTGEEAEAFEEDTDREAHIVTEAEAFA